MKFNKKSEFLKGKLKYLPILVIVLFLSLGGGRDGIRVGQRGLPGNDLVRQEEESAWGISETRMESSEQATEEETVEYPTTEISQTDWDAGAEESSANPSIQRNLILDTLTQESLIYIHVCGCVNKPGVYSFKKGARLQEAIMAADGFSVDADTEYWNLAETLSDGQQLRIPSKEEVREASLSSDGNLPPKTEDENLSISGGSAGTADTVPVPAPQNESHGIDAQGRVNVNIAGQDELKTLNGIGDVKSAAIIAYREEHGAFMSIDEIKNVSGIGKMTYEKIKDSITVN